MADGFAELIQKCQAALKFKYNAEQRSQAQACLQAELDLIEKRSFTETLLRAAHFGIKVQQSGRVCRLSGASCSSMINFLLGLSEVDPIQHRTLFQRFWITSSRAAPRFRFLIEQAEDHDSDDPPPEVVIVHEMAPMELAPDIATRQLPHIHIPPNDETTFAAITAGNTDGVLQFESDHVRKLAAKIRPQSIDDLAIITALCAIDNTHPDVVAEFLDRSGRASLINDSSQNTLADHIDAPLFQETVLSILHDDVGLSWPDAWRFILDAKKKKLNELSPLWKEAVQRTLNRGQSWPEAEQFVRDLVRASQTASCRAHHVANAITSYRAAFLRAHHRAAFESALIRIRG